MAVIRSICLSAWLEEGSRLQVASEAYGRHSGNMQLTIHPQLRSGIAESIICLDCYWVGSLDFHFLVEIKGVPLNPQKVKLFAAGSTATKLSCALHAKVQPLRQAFGPLPKAGPRDVLAGTGWDERAVFRCCLLWFLGGSQPSP